MDDRFEILRHYNLWDKEAPATGYYRTKYADRILAARGSRLIKVLVGQRRAGKSFILRQIAEKIIESGVDRKNVFIVNCELVGFNFLRTYTDLHQLFEAYKARIQPKGRIYLFIDEIQMIEGWERLANSYSQDYVDEYELFISGSNSNMLSGELATLLSGRYISFEIFPFSFDEYIGITGGEPTRQTYLDYMQSGGMPELFMRPDPNSRANYILDLKNTVFLRDIIERHNIKDVRLLEDLFAYLINNVSNMFSMSNIVNYMKSTGRKTSYETVASYIGFIENAYLVHRVERYNIKGKEILSGVCKYYINDLAFNNYLYQGFSYGADYLLENLIFLELSRNGFFVYTGNIKSKEVDFVATKVDRVIYIQCAYMLIDRETIDREYASLEAINDNYEKIVVSLDDIALPSKAGIKHIQAWKLANFLTS